MTGKIQAILGILPNRQLLEIKGGDGASFLQGLITTDIETVRDGTMMAGALLSPQGKVLFDFLVGKRGASFFLDLHHLAANDLAKRLGLYKLRSNVEIIVHALLPVAVSNQQIDLPHHFCFRDGRFATSLSLIRYYISEKKTPSLVHPRQEWDRIRIAHAVAESMTDFTLGDVFPHDINLDQIGGLSFKKGCYIGQEVVSRMQHRGTARRRLLLARAQTDLPPSGTVIEARAKPLGQLGSSVENQGLALVRLDRVKDAMDKGTAILADGVALELAIPERVQFSYPKTVSEGR